jgi:hypothetical protein
VSRARTAEARRRESELELARLGSDVEAWLVHRRAEDARSQYASQLRAIESLIEGALSGLRYSLETLDADLRTIDVYTACRAFDLRVAWLRRVWQFFREKFDQRDDPSLRNVLAAADEVVWSCYRQVVDRAELAGVAMTGPPPLPYIEPYSSPEAFPAELVPAGLKTEVDLEFAREHLNRLPIPVVRLQPACVSAPWWLVYLGHEVGHHVQYGLLDDMQLVGSFRGAVQEAVTAAGGTAQDVERWGRWSREIFADVCSLLFMGQWALRAIAELEIGPTSVMTRRRSTYPSPVVRLLLLRGTATRLGLDAQTWPAEVDLDGLAAADAGAAVDAAYIPGVIAAALEPADGIGRTLAWLTGFAVDQFGPSGSVARWRKRLGAAADPLVERSLQLPRVLTCAGLSAWTSVRDEAGEEIRDQLAGRVLDLIKRSGPEGTRAAAPPPAGTTLEMGEELAALLGRWEPELEAV